MESLGEDNAYSDSSTPSSAAREEPAVPDVIITRRLRDREQLRKRKAEAQDKDLIQWFLREQGNKQQRRGRKAGRGRSRQQLVKINQEPEPELAPQPDSQEEGDPGPSELALPELESQEELPVLTIQDLINEIQTEVEGELAASGQDPAGEVELLKPEEIPELPGVWETSLENDRQDN